jgi:hypothetical protein
MKIKQEINEFRYVLYISMTSAALCSCSGMAVYEGMRTQQQQTRDANRNSPDPLPPFDQYKKERDSMRPTGQ